MTPFEQGYKAFLDGEKKDNNPFNGDTCQRSNVRWIDGWTRARRDRK
jgi:ribosome modulation factor